MQQVHVWLILVCTVSCWVYFVQCWGIHVVVVYNVGTYVTYTTQFIYNITFTSFYAFTLFWTFLEFNDGIVMLDITWCCVVSQYWNIFNFLNFCPIPFFCCVLCCWLRYWYDCEGLKRKVEEMTTNEWATWVSQHGEVLLFVFAVDAFCMIRAVVVLSDVQSCTSEILPILRLNLISV